MFRHHNQGGASQGCNTAFKQHAANRFQGWGAQMRRPKHNVPINIEETSSDYIVSIYATGFAKENIKISVTDDLLYISGTRMTDENFKPEFIRQEFPVKTFERILQLNGQIVVESISAKQVNEVLFITLPKTVEARVETKEVKVD